MKKILFVISCLALVGLSGCASLWEGYGTTQSIQSKPEPTQLA